MGVESITGHCGMHPGERAMAGAGVSADSKARVVCAASASFASCPHRRRSPHLVDWYLVLAIDEDASEEAVRRRYRQLGKAMLTWNKNQRWCRSGGESPVYKIRKAPPFLELGF